jgi:8-oxo-dGTP pyrophosphatase MutT (NUDIX family)
MIEPAVPPAGDERALRALVRARLAGTRPGDGSDDRFLGLTPAESRRFRHLIPAKLAPAAVLVPIVDHPDGLTVLLTERAPDLRHHPGQVSFPGGRCEAGDADAVAAALRETEEEIGLDRRHVEVLGFLPDHVIFTGYRVTPVVGLVAPGAPLRLDATEVASVFEVPLRYVLDPANHRPRERPSGDGWPPLHDIPYGKRNIWGATAGMLITFARLLTQGPDDPAGAHG